jgi:alpha-amylase
VCILKLAFLASIFTTSSLSSANTKFDIQSPNFKPLTQEVYTPPGDAILHLFNYPFSLIEQELPEIAETGFKYIQISPPQLSRGDLEWYGRYQPLDYRIIDGPLGDERALRRLIKEAGKLQIGVIVDVVLNHMADLGDEYDLVYPPLWVQEKYEVGELFDKNNFHPAFCIKNYNDPNEVRKGRMCKPSKNTGGLPDLDLDQPYVEEVHKTYLENLIEMGAAGFRFDAAKHMELEYFQSLLSGGLANGKFLFAEIIADRNSYDRDLAPYLRHTNLKLMDFPLQKTMKDAFSWNGDLRLLLAGEEHRASLPGERSVSFVINHDIPNNDQFQYLILDPIDEKLAHIFMFARSGGVPHVYSDLGKHDRLKSDRWFFYHRKPVIRAGVKFHNLTQSASEKIIFANNCAIVIKRGVEGIATINKCSHDIRVRLKTPLQVPYVDLLSNAYLNTHNSQELVIPGRSGQLFVRAQ